MLLRSAWIVAWLMVSLKTQTSGPNATTFAPGHSDEDVSAGPLALAAPATWDGTAANAPPATSAAASKVTGCRRQRPVKPGMILFMALPFIPPGLSDRSAISLVVTRVRKPSIYPVFPGNDIETKPSGDHVNGA